MTILSETCRFILKHFLILLLLVNVGVYIVFLRLIYKKEKRDIWKQSLSYVRVVSLKSLN